MLANLLPGIRQIRTPLASGYLWLLTFWLLLPPHLKKAFPTSGVPGDIAHLVHYGGRVSVGIAVSFAAYLVGILSQFLNFPFVRLGTFIAYLPTMIKDAAMRFIGTMGIKFSISFFVVEIPIFNLAGRADNPAEKAWESQRRQTLSSGQLSAKGIISLQNFVADMPDIKQDQISEWNILAYRRLTYLSREVPHQGNALVGRETDLYSVYDRLISEYEFRIGISLPLAAIILILATRWSLLWLTLLLPLLILLATGAQQRMAAGDLLADSVRLKRIEIAMPSEITEPPTKTEPPTNTRNHETVAPSKTAKPWWRSRS